MSSSDMMGLLDTWRRIGRDRRRKVVVFLIVWTILAILGSLVGGGEIVGVHPIFLGFIPAWVVALYAIFIPVILGYFWFFDALDEYVIGEDQPPTFRGGE